MRTNNLPRFIAVIVFVIMKEKVLGKIEVAGLTIVLLAACMWMLPQVRFWASVFMAVGTVMLAVGRFMQRPFYEQYSPTHPKELSLRRLYHQRVFGIVGLILATTFMFLPAGFYAGVYVGISSWLIPFTFFVTVEVYTVFRISALEKS